MLDRIVPILEVRRAHKVSKSRDTHGKIVPRISNRNGTMEKKQSRLVRSSLREFAKNSRIFQNICAQRKHNHEPFSLVEPVLTTLLAFDLLIPSQTKGNTKL